jgi:hypothetical protein
VGVGRAHGIAVDAARADAPPPTPFDRVVEGQHHGPVRREGVDEQPEQDPASGARAPRRAAEHAVEVDEAALARAAGDPQRARHGAPPRGQHRADQQHPGVPPGAMDEQRRERQDDRGEAGGQVRHGASLGGDAPNLPATSASSPLPVHRPAEMAKVELRAAERKSLRKRSR